MIAFAGMLLQWGHGDEAVEETDSTVMTISSPMLQWGHGDEAVEELDALLDELAGGQTASMGPRR